MITPLQLVLAGVALVLVVGIVLYNMYQERRFRKEADRMFSHHREDILLGDAVQKEKQENRDEPPVAGISLHAAPSESEPSGPDIDLSAQYPVSRLEQRETAETPTISPAPFPFSAEEEEAAEPVTPPVPEAAPWLPSAPESTSDAKRASNGESGLDPETEFVARIRFTTPSAARFGHLLATLNRIGKPIRALGRRLDGSIEVLEGQTQTSFDSVEIGLQLADRSGPVSHDQIDAFCRALYGFAAEEGGAVICPDKQDALRAAKTLDQLCMEVDVLIGLNVIATETRPFSCEAIHKQAEAAGLEFENDGGYHARDIEGHGLFSMVNKDGQPFKADCRGFSIRGITLLFDVPRVAEGLAVFDRMTRFGFSLADALEGRLVDDGGRPVTEETLNRDRARLIAFYSRMNARSIPAGGERALRLFA